jgi:hypothetical protein
MRPLEDTFKASFDKAAVVALRMLLADFPRPEGQHGRLKRGGDNWTHTMHEDGWRQIPGTRCYF